MRFVVTIAPYRMSDVDVDTHAVAVTINGVAIPLVPPTIAAALSYLSASMSTKHVAVAVNDAVISRAAWDSVRLMAGDRVEIVSAVAGG